MKITRVVKKYDLVITYHVVLAVMGIAIATNLWEKL